LTDRIGSSVLSARFHRDLLEEVINRTGCREKRNCRLPAHVMIRYVIAMGLFCDDSCEEVMRRLVDSLKKMGAPGQMTSRYRPFVDDEHPVGALPDRTHSRTTAP
jgi:hypothetical protein